MAQFDVYKNPQGGVHSLVVDLQNGLLERLETRIVAPLVATNRYDEKPMLRVHPIVSVKNGSYAVLMHLMAGIDISTLGQRVGSLAAYRSELIAALDLLITGS